MATGSVKAEINSSYIECDIIKFWNIYYVAGHWERFYNIVYTL